MKRAILSFLFTLALCGTAAAAPLIGSDMLRSPIRSAPAVKHSPPVRPSPVVRAEVTRRVEPTPVWTQAMSGIHAEGTLDESCLAKAVYFEARSEPEAGQLAVATVILNRVKSPSYPSTICRVVYQGASRFNSCQFSFACDGKADIPDDERAWVAAAALAELVLTNKAADGELQIISNATHYHADYVKPRWSKSLNRLTQIGHHIFYAQDVRVSATGNAKPDLAVSSRLHWHI